jgi:glycosyltransferase involved in cell wall biosynthesis
MTEHAGPFSDLFKSEFQKSLIRETLTEVKRVIAVSPALAEQIRSFVPTVDVDIVGNVIRTDFFTPPEDSPDHDHLPVRRFLSVALLEEAKGIEYLLQAIDLLIQRGVTSFEVYIGGDGSARPRLEQMAKKLGLSDKCHFLGFITRSMVRHWMRQCDVFVLPSLGETFGIVLGEAMACGKPVISTRCGGPDLLVAPETGFLVDVASAPALADAMEKFISQQITHDPHLIRKTIVARFGEEAFLHNISTIYSKV